MFSDLAFVLKSWRLVHLLGISSLRSRYARSKFGQAWLSITTFVQILCTGLVWSLIWRMEINEYLPYVGVGHIVYLFASQTINDSTGIFVADARIYLNGKMPFMLSVGAHLYRSILNLAHNIPTIIVLLIWSDKTQSHINHSFLLGCILTLIFICFSSYFFATICTRFRDLTQLISLLFQLIFLITPIMWKISFLPQKYQAYAYINPFASILELIRNPLIGIPANDLALVSLTIWTCVAAVASIATYAKLNKNIIYWV
jgi:lipopolysaccharide transport system permease protein